MYRNHLVWPEGKKKKKLKPYYFVWLHFLCEKYIINTELGTEKSKQIKEHKYIPLDGTGILF